MQSLIVALIVGVCAVYAAWTLMPAAWRRRLAQALSRWPLLGRQPPVQRAARASAGGCGCDGCDAPASAGSPGVKTVTVVRRVK